MNISNHHGDRLLSEDSAKQSSLNRVITAALLNLLLLQSYILSPSVQGELEEGETGISTKLKSQIEVDHSKLLTEEVLYLLHIFLCLRFRKLTPCTH